MRSSSSSPTSSSGRSGEAASISQRPSGTLAAPKRVAAHTPRRWPVCRVWPPETPMSEARTAYRTCPLCEATCGLEIRLDDGRVTAIRGDDDDVFSHGFICPKGPALKALHEDPDRVRTPLIRS